MDTKVNYLAVGLFVIGLTFVIIFAFLWIAGGHQYKNYKAYLTFANETVDGLSEKSVVKFNGVDVGFVEKMALNPSNPQQVRLDLKILADIPINQSTVATIRSLGITGISYLGLQAMKKEAPPLVKPATEPYPVIPYSASLFKQMDDVAQDVSQNVTKVTNALSELLGEDNQQYVRHILSNIADITKTLEQNTEEIDSILQASSKLLKNSANASKQFEDMVSELRATLKTAKAAATHLSEMSSAAKKTFSSGNNAIKDIGDQLLPNAYITLDKLKRTMTNIETLTHDLNRNPSILLRGKHASVAGPGE